MAENLQEIFNGREVLYAFFAKSYLEPFSDYEYKMIQDIIPYLKELEDISDKAKHEINMLEQQANIYKTVLQQKTQMARNIRSQIDDIDNLPPEILSRLATKHIPLHWLRAF